MGHIVKHDDVGAGFHSFADHVEVLDLHFDLADKGSIGFGSSDGFFDAACRADMVVLQHDAVGEVVTVVVPAAAGDRVFFEDAVVRRRLAGVQQPRLRAFQKVRDVLCVSGDAAHSLQIVERGALAAQDDTDVAVDLRHEGALRDEVAVFDEEFDAGLRVQERKDALKDLQAADDAVLLADEVCLPRLRVGHDAVGGDVLAGDVLLQGAQDQRIDIEFQGDRIKHVLQTSFLHRRRWDSGSHPVRSSK